ncbi:MAG: ferritin family protein [Desulfobacterales bacterium]|nr:ferritin family protein [Desulfobacterales bacterium]MDJ0854676.1 ferritin family protein [Desulfobacterales bacterium]
MFTLQDVLDMAAQIERNGEKVYRQALARTDDPELAEMLAWMAEEEARHAAHFEDQRLRLMGEDDNILLEELGRLMLESIVGDRGFSLEDVDFNQIAEVNELLQVMIDFEQDTLEFYRLFQQLIASDSDRRKLGRIIADEEEHIRKLLSCRDENLACHKR